MDLRAVIFVPALAGCVIFGFVFALFASHYYLMLLQGTGAGAKRVTWESEPILDSFWKVFYLAWLIGLWLGPAWLLGRAFTAGSSAVWPKYAVPLAVFWLCYPVSQLSSLSGPSIWLPLHPDVFGRLVRRPGVVLGFLGLSGLALAGIGLGFYWTFRADGLHWLAIGSVVFVAFGLLYARLLGRLAFVLVFTRSILSRRKKKRPAADEVGSVGTKAGEPDTPAEAEPRGEEVTNFTQPSDLPPILTPDEGPLSGYDVKFDNAPRKRRKRVVAEVVNDGADVHPTADAERSEPAPRARPRHADDDEDDTPYGVNEAEVPPEERAPESLVKPPAEEMRLLNRDDAPKPPKRVWTADVFAFLGQPETVTVVLLLSVLCAVAGGMVRIACHFNPVGDAS